MMEERRGRSEGSFFKDSQDANWGGTHDGFHDHTTSDIVQVRKSEKIRKLKHEIAEKIEELRSLKLRLKELKK